MTYTPEQLEEQKKTYELTLELFKGRCAYHLSHPAQCVHEIEPRSYRPKDWWDIDNRIPLCNQIHTQIHNEGWRNWVDILREKRTKALKLTSPTWVKEV